jgi:hypothetical protein
VVTTVLVIAPITIRNWVVYRHFIPVSIGAGITMIEGIADYDEEEKIGLPSFDASLSEKEAHWYDRADYAEDLWKPDGVERDQARLSRGLSVIRKNPVWFLGVMCKRAVSMLRYNDFLPHNSALNTSIAPTVLPAPNYGHSLETRGETVWVQSPEDLFRNGASRAESAEVSLVGNNAMLQIACDGVEYREQFASPAIAVQRNTDYLLTIPVGLSEGSTEIKIATADPRITLERARVPKPPRRNKKKVPREASGLDIVEPTQTNLKIPFASSANQEIRVILSTHGFGADRPVVQIGTLELSAVGPTPHQWTRIPRSLIRGVQKNVFKTERLLPVNLIGIALFAVAGRRRALAVLLAVPAYYLIVQSAFHTEYRYIVVMHYFLFVMGAVALYLLGAALNQLWRLKFNAAK